MKVRFELNERDNREDIITFDFTRLLTYRTPEDDQLNRVLNLKELYLIAKDIISNPLDTWEEYSEPNYEDEPIYVYPKKDCNILFSVIYYKEWRNKDRKYQLLIEGLQKGEVCLARDIR